MKIIHRPEEVDARLIPGHWARTLGRRHDQGRLQPLVRGHPGRAQDPLRHAALRLIPRINRLTLALCKMDGNGAEAAPEGFSRQMKRLPLGLRKSMTCDRGLEMACHPDLAPPKWPATSRSTSGSATPMPPGSAGPTKTPTGLGTTIDPPDQSLHA